MSNRCFVISFAVISAIAIGLLLHWLATRGTRLDIAFGIGAIALYLLMVAPIGASLWSLKR